ncbi:uracil-DNA glycosylase [Grosmannia clavigera kw1407]|uniref:Uracil-DNA glycosylase n=1 Tax=Grosmannia clavigera (strain kw1407 / UAMH 11150) TaxID=655863 RepID=F0XUA9_GROCL|nr:uracil-DNA glycosylase [Grosmannia clavigera kw1407]EFW98843.1 uracil-DNA glycosylase [Grosmannia clavigera kw1407]
MQENDSSPSSKNGAASSSTSQSVSKEQRMDTFSVHAILSRAGNALQQADAELDIKLPIPLPKLPQLLAAVQPTLLSSKIAPNIDVSVSHKLSAEGRAKLRQLANEMRVLCFQESNAIPPRTLPIYTSEALADTAVPKPLTPEKREKVKAMFHDLLTSKKDIPDPYLSIPVSLEDQFVPSVKGNVEISAVDDDGQMPTKHLNGMDCLWDTGSQHTIVSEDILGRDFGDFLHNNEINKPYIHTMERVGGILTKVQVSALIKISNGSFQFDTIALVVPLRAIPNQRSGIIIGQKGVIERIQYVSIPRSIMKAEGADPGEGYWGTFNVDKYLDVCDEMIRV